MRRPTRALAPFSCWLLGCASTGVGNPPDIDQAEQALVDLGNDATDAGDTASALVSVPTLAHSDPAFLVSSDTAAGIAETETPLFFEPAGCLVTTRDALSVTFDFQGCRTGAAGLLALNGQLTATYTVSAPGSISVEIATSALSLALAQITLSATASFSLVDTTRTIVWNGSYQAARPVRPDIDHAASYQASYDTATQCVSLAGTATTTFADGVGVESSVTGYERCGAKTACPLGGTLTLTELPERTRSLSVEYLGGPRLRVQVPRRGVDVERPLACDG